MIEFSFQGGVLLARAEGRIDLEAIEDAMLRLVVHPLYSSKHHLLIDVRNVEALDLDEHSLRKLAERERNKTTPRRIAIVAADDLVFGISRVFQSLTIQAPSDCKVFKDYYLAMAWLVHGDKPPRPDWDTRRQG